MTPEEFAAKMRAIFGGDPHNGIYDEEIAHSAADNLMCEVLTELGYGDGVKLFLDADKWYA